MKLTIFGANLRDQSKGQFVVHATGCAHCARLAREHKSTGEYISQEAVVRDIYADQMNEGLELADAWGDVHFCPCTDALPTSSPVAFLDGRPM